MMRIGTYGAQGGQLRWPYHAAAAGGECYVSDSENHRIAVYDLDGEFLRSFGSKGKGAGQLNRPRGLAVHEDFIFVADCDNHRVSIFNCNGQWLGFIGYGSDVHPWGSYEEEAPRLTLAAGVNGEERQPLLSFPHAIGVMNGRLYVASMGSNDVAVFSLDGTLITRFGGAPDVNGALDRFFSGSAPAERLSWPKGLCCHHDTVFIADTGNNRVVAFTGEGRFLREWGRKGSEPREFINPTGIDAYDGYLYVAEHVGRRIQVFTLDGGYVKETPIPACGDLLGLFVDEARRHDSRAALLPSPRSLRPPIHVRLLSSL